MAAGAEMSPTRSPAIRFRSLQRCESFVCHPSAGLLEALLAPTEQKDMIIIKPNSYPSVKGVLASLITSCGAHACCKVALSTCVHSVRRAVGEEGGLTCSDCGAGLGCTPVTSARDFVGGLCGSALSLL